MSKKTTKVDNSDISPLGALQAWIEQVAKKGVDEEKVKEIVQKAISSMPPRTIEIKTPEFTNKIEGASHYYLELVLKAVSSTVNIALAGTAATSKTTMAIQSAQALNKQFMLFKPVASPFELTGYMDANGNYVPSNLYRAHKEGMIAIFDEFDASDPAATLVMNSIIENKTFTYPNGETVTNPELQIIFTMNTKGTGSDRKFVGRNRLDAATLDRFCVIEVPQDPSLEASILGITEEQPKVDIASGGVPSAEKWLSIVRKHRINFAQSHPDKIISLRAARDGWKLAQAGIGVDHLTNICIYK